MDKFYVYQFINDDWGVPFYVGKGFKGRYMQMHGRSKHIKAICSHFNWHSEIVKYFDSEDSAYQYEQELKLQHKNLGYPIIDGEANATHKEAQRIGIERAKLAGVFKGRKPVSIPNFAEHYQRWKTRQITKSALAEELKITRPTLDKLIKDFETI
jgi:hypothetical protein